jgi:hypothetical protein
MEILILSGHKQTQWNKGGENLIDSPHLNLVVIPKTNLGYSM